MDMFGDIWERTTWQDGQIGKYMHQSCYFSISSSDKLKKAKIRLAKNKATVVEAGQPQASAIPPSLPVKITRLLGILHDKRLCETRRQL